jgi:hypothetical protein
MMLAILTISGLALALAITWLRVNADQRRQKAA